MREVNGTGTHLGPDHPPVTRELDRLRSHTNNGRAWPGAGGADYSFGNGPRMRLLEDMIDRVAMTDATVLVSGESGVGKELVARALHERSPRRGRPFVKVNCAALPLELLESELFGYERGAFTGAHRQKPGKFELANTGTIFLDEVGEFPIPLQAKLLQVLQDREFSRLGSEHDVRVDVRVIAATNKDLAKLLERGGFRADLYYRLNVVNIRVPPLRERPEEIPRLVEQFLRHYAQHYSRPRPRLSQQTMRRFTEYHWPGNIRELENVMRRIIVLSNDEWVVEDLVIQGTPADERGAPTIAKTRSPMADEADERDIDRVDLKEIARRAARSAERAAIKTTLEQVRWNRVEAARRLKINYKTLLRKIQDCDLDR